MDFKNIGAYLPIFKYIAQRNRRFLPTIILKMILARIVFNLSSIEYALFDIDNVSILKWNNYFSKKKLDKILDLFNPPNFHTLVEDKLKFHERCEGRGILSPKILAVISNNHKKYDYWVPKGAYLIKRKKELCNFLCNDEIPKKLFSKVVNGTYGEDTLSFIVMPNNCYNINGENFSINHIVEYYFKSEQEKVYIVQEHLRPHKALEQIMPGEALGTIRVVTYLDKGIPHVLYVFIKIPVKGNVTDNFHHGNTGNLLANVEPKTGTIGKAFGKKRGIKDFCLSEFITHPNTGINLLGFQIPEWQEILKVAKQGAMAFPELKTIGWDIALCNSGPLMIEGNHHWDPDGPQITLRRGIKKEIITLV